ncbi:MAG: YbjQ family protein [Candidatus Bathyarchaeota archaeon]
MIITTMEKIPNAEVSEVLGVVWGSSIRAKHLGNNIVMALKKIVGGELGAYTQMLEEARREAVSRMVSQAKKLGADAVVGFRFSTSMVTTGAAEIIAYGTAVKLKSRFTL